MQRIGPGLGQLDLDQVADLRLAFNQASVGRRCSVLVERKGKKPGQWLGKSPWLQSVHFEGEAAIGDLVEVELTQAGPNSLHGEILQAALA